MIVKIGSLIFPVLRSAEAQLERVLTGDASTALESTRIRRWAWWARSLNASQGHIRLKLRFSTPLASREISKNHMHSEEMPAVAKKHDENCDVSPKKEQFDPDTGSKIPRRQIEFDAYRRSDPSQTKRPRQNREPEYLLFSMSSAVSCQLLSSYNRLHTFATRIASIGSAGSR